MTWVVIVTAVTLGVGAVMALIRIERERSVLDRMVGLDVITSILIIGVALEAAWNRRTLTIPILAALSLVGFVGSLSMARFAAIEPEDAGRLQTPEEARAEAAARAQAEEEAARLEAEIAASRDDRAGS